MKFSEIKKFLIDLAHAENSVTVSLKPKQFLLLNTEASLVPNFGYFGRYLSSPP